MSETMRIPILRCARCGTDHEIEFKHFVGASLEDPGGVIYDWWGLCPVTGDPVFMTNQHPDLVDPTPSGELPARSDDKDFIGGAASNGPLPDWMRVIVRDDGVYVIAQEGTLGASAHLSNGTLTYAGQKGITPEFARRFAEALLRAVAIAKGSTRGKS